MNEKAVSGRTDEQHAGSGADVRRTQGVSIEKRDPASWSLLLSLVPEVVLLAAAVYLFVVALGFRQVGPSDQIGPGFWPQVLCVGIAIGALVRIGQKLWSGERWVAQDAASETDEVRMPRVALGIALVGSYIVGMLFLGYILATALFLIVFIYLGGQRKWYVVPLGIASSLVFAYVFLKVVYIALPSGVGVFDQLTVLLYELLGIY
jgi:putative tricarboxylic transport membrane protein